MKFLRFRNGKYRNKVIHKRLYKKNSYNNLGLIFLIAIVLIFSSWVMFRKKEKQSLTNLKEKSSFQSNYFPMEEDSYKFTKDKSILYEVLKDQMGKPYQYGSTGPDAFDCSGLTQFAFSKLGIELPRIAQDQSEVGIEVDKSALEFGDILFFAKDGSHINHEGIYVGNGKMIHAPQTGDIVKIGSLDGYYEKNFKKAIRILK